MELAPTNVPADAGAASYRDLPFMTGCGVQKYLPAEEGILDAVKQQCSHWYIDGAHDHDRATAWTQDRLDRMNGLIAEHGAQPIFHGSFKLPIGSDVPELRAAAMVLVKKEIDVSGALSAPLIIHAGAIVEPRLVRPCKERALAGYIDALSELAVYAEERGVDLWLENLCNYQKFHPFYYIFTNAAEYDAVFGQIANHNVKMMLDICHETVGGGDPIKVFKKHHRRIAALSVSDTDGARDYHWPLGRGSIDYTTVLRVIRETGWTGIVNFETRGDDVRKDVAYLGRLLDEIDTAGTA